MYRALDLLIDQTPPLLKGRRPFWRPSPAPVWKDVREPSWSWSLDLVPHVDQSSPGACRWGLAGGHGHLLAEDDTVITLDATAAYVTAASSVDVAHGALEHTGRRDFDPKRPGYWLIDAHPWQGSWMWSPLGTAKHPERVWVTTPTVQLLAHLTEVGYWPEVHVRDSWTSGARCRLRGWAERIMADRCAAIGDDDRYVEVKTGYSQAVTLMAMDKKSLCFRPDWAQHIRAQHAANMWRRASQAFMYGPILASGTVDEVTTTQAAMERMEDLRAQGHRTPLPLDQTGRKLGTFTVKAVCSAREWVTR